MVQAKFLQAGRVDQLAAVVQIVKTGVGGGVAAGIERGGNLAGAGGIETEQGVGQRRFAHAALAEQDGGFAGQQRLERIGIFQRA